MKFRTTFRWSLVVVGRWSLFRGRFSTKFAWAGFRVVLLTGGRCSEVVVSTGLTVFVN